MKLLIQTNLICALLSPLCYGEHSFKAQSEAALRKEFKEEQSTPLPSTMASSLQIEPAQSIGSQVVYSPKPSPYISLNSTLSYHDIKLQKETQHSIPEGLLIFIVSNLLSHATTLTEQSGAPFTASHKTKHSAQVPVIEQSLVLHLPF